VKAIFLAFLLAVVSGETFDQADPALRLNISAITQVSKGIESANSQHAGIDSAKQGSIRKLLELQGSNDCMNRLPFEMFENLPAGNSQERLQKLLVNRLKEKIVSDEINVSMSVYDKHFSQSEIDGLVSFYSAPLGTKALSVRDQVLVETRSRLAKFASQWSQEALNEVLNENPDLRKAIEADPGRDTKR